MLPCQLASIKSTDPHIGARYLFLPSAATTIADVWSNPNVDTAQDRAPSARSNLAPILAFHIAQTNLLVATPTMEFVHFSF